ncbi:MAG TPA: ArsR family transcriptional regulator [Pyrinomonadaceae bacterium]|nr:ArsR family transcriptional regulator [Pyrinomonadaceae bacterium]
MSENKFDRRFFESTRGQIVALLHGSNKTVNELADALGLSDNAVRAHLLTLERDQLVIQAGLVKGFRKPHFTYGLGPEARRLFPRSYDALFNQLLTVLKNTLSPRALKKTLIEVGRKFGMNAGSGNLDERLAQALAALKELGGAAAIVKEDGRMMIKSDSCPFAEAVAEHPEVCKVAESMVGEILDRKVVERCDRTGAPKCCFEISIA